MKTSVKVDSKGNGESKSGGEGIGKGESRGEGNCSTKNQL